VHSYTSFTVKRELAFQPAVPEFSYKQVESTVFIDEFGSIDSSADLEKRYADVLKKSGASAL
jgi:hypothetical protein